MLKFLSLSLIAFSLFTVSAEACGDKACGDKACNNKECTQKTGAAEKSCKDHSKKTASKATGPSIVATEFGRNVAVEGMHCGGCAASLEKKFKAQPAVEDVQVSFADGQMRLVFKKGQAMTDAEITQLVVDTGYKVAGAATTAAVDTKAVTK